jgi:hypothetical protein
MNTDEHGLRQGKRFLQRKGKASFIGELVCIAEIFFLSVFIRVHPWSKDFSTAWIPLKPELQL